jgi:peptidoglycan glycosyltransferase
MTRTRLPRFLSLALAALVFASAGEARADKRGRKPAERASEAGAHLPTAGDLGSLAENARWDDRRGKFVAALRDGREAELTLDRRLQGDLTRLLKRFRVPYASVVAMDPRTGKVLGLAETGDQRRGEAGVAKPVFPAASIFKIVTGAALLEAGITPQEEVCYHGGFHALQAAELRDDPRRDRDCATLSTAMGKSLNVVFGKLAARTLSAETLATAAERFFFNRPLPGLEPARKSADRFVSSASIPDDTLGFGRAAAGFGQVYLSPLHGAVLASAVGNDGVAVEPHLVAATVKKGVRTLLPAPREHRVVSPEVSASLTRMMERTVADGTARKAFAFKRNERWLGPVRVAGKTGSLADHPPKPFRDYSWFVGFAPANDPKIAVAVVVVNGPFWAVKAPYLAKEAFASYLTGDGASARRAER